MKKDFINFSILAAMALSITGCSHDFDLYEGPQPDGSEQEPKVATPDCSAAVSPFIKDR